jgi:hypothetical protein
MPPTSDETVPWSSAGLSELGSTCSATTSVFSEPLVLGLADDVTLPQPFKSSAAVRTAAAAPVDATLTR